ncbi:MAG: HAMP domain-containing protein [Proteobacteria bacterium]|nr:HAMP domain-containing protein [Pseudomonadota bacterium]
MKNLSPKKKKKQKKGGFSRNLEIPKPSLPKLRRREKGESTNPSEHQRIIRNRIWFLGALVFIFIISLLVFNFYYSGLQHWSDFDSNLNFFLLINLNVILLIFATSLILRNLIKLLYERRRRKLGFRLKMKLTLGFILVSAFPLILFFFVVNGFLTNSLDFWFQGQFSEALKNSSILIENYGQDQKKDLKHFVAIIAADYLNSSREEVLASKSPGVKDWMLATNQRYRIDGMTWYDESLSPLITQINDEDKEQIWSPIPKDEFKVRIDEFPQNYTHQHLSGQIYRALLPVRIEKNLYYLEITKILAGDLYSDLAKLRQNLVDHKMLIKLEIPIRTSSTAGLVLFTLLMIFGGIWFGYYLARSIVEPIEILVGGTRRIAKGDLDFQIDLKVDDEIGMLLDSFNSMTKELQQSRRKLAKSQADLIEINRVLEERNVFVELVVQNIQIGVFSIDNSGYVSWINPFMIKMFRIKSPKIISKHYRSILSKEQIKQFELLGNELTTSGEHSARLEAHIQKDKRSLHMSMELFQLMTPQGKHMGRLLVVDDMTELDRSTRARAWREVARRIAHEIKNPLTPIQLSAQRIRRKYIDEMEDSQLLNICTATIINEVNDLKKMVNEFSKFARIPEINPGPLNINQILSEVYDLFQPGLPKGVNLSLKIDSNVPKTLLDGEQFKRVLTNLLDNAFAALGDTGSVELFSSFSKELQMVTVKVLDNGCGIPREMLHQIFDPYVTTKKDGTGLGLAIVQQIITDHGGFIRIENTKGGGTTVTIELPASFSRSSSKPVNL